MTMRKLLAGAASIAAVAIVWMLAMAAIGGCSPVADNNYHGTVGSPSTSIAFTPAVPAYPVTISGSGEQVKTANLVATGYTVNYQASSFTLIVFPVRADGSDGLYVVNAIGQDYSNGVTGTTTYRATGRTTFHVTNTQGPWSLTFTPLT